MLGTAGLLEETVRVETDYVVNQTSLEHGDHQVREEGTVGNFCPQNPWIENGHKKTIYFFWWDP